jgi:hypothetical protein
LAFPGAICAPAVHYLYYTERIQEKLQVLGITLLVRGSVAASWKK